MQLEEMFYITEKDWYKLQAWAKLAYDEDKNEISGLMTAVPQEDGRFKIGDVEILEQENTGTNTELNGDAVSSYMMKHATRYNNPQMKFVWWHSHHTMAAFWSATDEKEIDAWKNTSFSLALVINLKEEYKFRVSLWNANGIPLEEHFDTTLTIERPQPKINITDDMKTLYKELCSSPVVQNNWHRHAFGSYNGQLSLYSRSQNEKSLIIEEEYSKILDEAENIQDDMVSGVIKLKDYKKSIKDINKNCDKSKLPFKLKVIKGNTQDIINKLMTLMPNELFEWEDNRLKDKYETIAWSNTFGGGRWYGN
tara:strand:+ start:95 stop:1021 length:927 start_codon:yes stop_codon:yes gene_type:complete